LIKQSQNTEVSTKFSIEIHEGFRKWRYCTPQSHPSHDHFRIETYGFTTGDGWFNQNAASEETSEEVAKAKGELKQQMVSRSQCFFLMEFPSGHQNMATWQLKIL